MMYLLLTLFFVSLFSIIFMIGRKLVFLKHIQILNHEEVLFEVPYFKEIKHATVTNAKKHGYSLLVVMVRWYVKGANYIKNKYKNIIKKIEDGSREKNINGQKKEISKFLKIIGDYKHKIREIRHKIKKEENL